MAHRTLCFSVVDRFIIKSYSAVCLYYTCFAAAHSVTRYATQDSCSWHQSCVAAANRSGAPRKGASIPAQMRARVACFKTTKLFIRATHACCAADPASVQALDVALGDNTGLLGQHASRCQLLSSTSLRDRLGECVLAYCVASLTVIRQTPRMLAHAHACHPRTPAACLPMLCEHAATRLAGTSGDQLNTQRHSTPEQPDNAAHDAQQLLLTSAQLQHAHVHAQRVAELAARAAALHVSAAVLEKDEGAQNACKRCPTTCSV